MRGQSIISKDMNPSVHGSFIHSGQDMETTKVTFGRDWIKILYMYTVDYYSATRKDEILPLATTWMDLENIVLSEISESEKAKKHVISLKCGM